MNPGVPAAPLSPVQSLGSAALSLLVVLALILALAWVLKRLRTNAIGGGSQLRVKASLALGVKERVVLIDAAGEHLLLGVSPAGVTCLHRYAVAPVEPAAAESPFASLLRVAGRTKDAGNAR